MKAPQIFQEKIEFPTCRHHEYESLVSEQDAQLMSRDDVCDPTDKMRVPSNNFPNWT
jgi:hypothetical protein